MYLFDETHASAYRVGTGYRCSSINFAFGAFLPYVFNEGRGSCCFVVIILVKVKSNRRLRSNVAINYASSSNNNMGNTHLQQAQQC